MLFVQSVSQVRPIEARLAEIESGVQGRLGAAIITPKAAYYSQKSERFSIQSVMKLVVSMAALDQVDRGKWKVGQKFTFGRSDFSLSVQPLAERLGKRNSMTVSLEDCIELTVTESCSAAGDFLIRKMGGVQVVNAFLRKKGIAGLTVDRQERDLQTQIVGLTWKPEYVDSAKLDRAIQAVPKAEKSAAYKRYQADRRDTSTPEAMAMLLKKLVTGQLLSKRSTDYLLGVMGRTKTGPDRLAAGVPKGWKLGHKTGTSSTMDGVSCATNDVGIARRANGDWVVIVAFVGDSIANDTERARAISQVAKLALGKSDLEITD
ncbi:PenP Beta-lactamase class A [Fimbriimonadaceae bacterium]